MIDKAQADLSDKQFGYLTQMVGNEAASEPPADLTAADMTAIMTFVTSASEECTAS